MDSIDAYGRHLLAIGRREETVRNRLGYLRRARRTLGVDVLDADPHLVEAWWACHGSREGKVGARASVVGYVQWAREHGRLDTSADDPGRLLPKVRLRPGLPRPVSDESIRAALAVAEPRAAVAITLSATNGLRAGEIAQLDWSDVDLSAGRARIEGKGGKDAVIPLSADSVRVLRRLGPLRSGPVIRGRNGALVSSSVSTLAAKAFRDAGHPGVRLHQCRHRCGTQTYATTHDLLVTSRVLRHASPQTTTIYVELSGDGVAGAVNRLPRLTDEDGQDGAVMAA